MNARLSTALLVTTSLLAACQSTQQAAVERSRSAPQHAPAPISAMPDHQDTFASPNDALQALTAAAKKQDMAALRQIFGPRIDQVASTDDVEKKAALQRFSDHLTQKAHMDLQNGGTAADLFIGENDYPFPIPLAKDAAGQWFFDTAAGETELLKRRIGNDELNTIDAMRAFADAQREYASIDRDGNGIVEYADRFLSTPGHHDGLYWPASVFEGQSPLGPLAAQAAAEGYPVATSSSDATGRHPFHGYYFKILTRQGPAAPGGAYNYKINGHMVAGFAFLAYPSEYGKSGIMTFIINRNNVLYQQDLGTNTEARAKAITTFNPDGHWTPVKDAAPDSGSATRP